MKYFLLISLALVISWSGFAAQDAAAPTGQAAAGRGQTPAPTGTSRVRGRIVSAETGRGLRDTAVRIVGGGLRTPKIVVTSTHGSYEIDALPAGRYTLSAIKSGYLRLEYGQRRPFETGRFIDLADKQTIDDVNLSLPKGGVIVARVLDEAGEPMAGVTAQVERYRVVQGQRRLERVPLQALPGNTDDRGEVRLHSLAPGDYYLSARAGGIAPILPTLAAAGKRSYIPTYYPGTASPGNARSVWVQIGRDTPVTIPMVAGRLAQVSGRVVTSATASGPVSVYLEAPTTDGGLRNVSAQPDGTFSIDGLVPGEYSLTAALSMGRPGAEYGRLPLTIVGDDLSDLIVTTGPPGALRGRFVYDAPTPPARRPGALQPVATPYSARAGIGLATRTAVQEDGTFEVTGLVGDRLIRLQAMSDGWFLKTVMLDGRDVTDTPLNFDGSRTIIGVDIIVSQVQTTLEGGAIAADNSPASAYVAVVFPEDREKWTPQSRFIAAARPDQRGNFKIVGLPAGRYLAAAIEYLETGSERDAGVLEHLRTGAVPILLAEGESKAISLRVLPY